MGPSLSLNYTNNASYITAFFKTVNQTIVKNTVNVVSRARSVQSNVLNFGGPLCGNLKQQPTNYGPKLTLSNEASSSSIIEGGTVGSLSASLKEQLRTDLQNFVKTESTTTPSGIFSGLAAGVAITYNTTMSNLVDEVINAIDWEQKTNCEVEQSGTQNNVLTLCGDIYGDVVLNNKVFYVATASCIGKLLVDSILQNETLVKVLNDTQTKYQVGGGGLPWWAYLIIAIIIIIIIIAVVVSVTQSNKKKAAATKKPPPKKPPPKVTRPPMPLPPQATLMVTA